MRVNETDNSSHSQHRWTAAAPERLTELLAARVHFNGKHSVGRSVGLRSSSVADCVPMSAFMVYQRKSAMVTERVPAGITLQPNANKKNH